MSVNTDVIVSRHPAAIEFIRIEAHLDPATPVLSEATADQVRGKIVYGNLPLHLACHAGVVMALEFTGAPPRGQEYGIKEMLSAGAHLECYRVEKMPEGLRLASRLT